MTNRIVVAGAGQAAIAFAAKMRELDEKSEIILLGSEASLPYQRPPLSKKYMTGEMDAERLLLRPAEWYAENRVECRTACRVLGLHPQTREIEIEGERIAYDKLVIATGATPRKLPAETGGSLEGVFTLRDLDDADAIAPHMREGANALIIGGGYIGLEAAAVLTGKGMKVTVIEMADRILKRVAAAETAAFVRARHEAEGVTILEDTALAHLDGENGRLTGATLADGRRLEAGLAIAGIGVIPDDALARQAGLACSNGIDVDALTRTSDPHIHAAGDVANFEFRGQRIRLESVQNAIDQAEHAARVIAGSAEPYVPLPWFWSDQYDMKLQIAGLNTGYDHTVTRPGSREGGQSVWYFADGKFIAVDAINDPKAYMTGKKLLETNKPLTPAQAGDASFDLMGLVKG